MAEEKKDPVDIEEEDDETITTDEDDDESGEETTEKKDDKKDDDAGEEDQEEDQDEEDDEDEVDEGFKPPVRKSVAQHIISRQKKTIEKLRSKKEEDDDEGADDTDDDEEDDGYDATAKKVIGREVQKRLDPLIQTLASKADEDELQELFASEPEAKKFEKRIRAYMAHPGWKAVPPSAIYHHLAFKKKDASDGKKKAADIEAGQHKGAGSGRRATKATGKIPSADEIDDMTDEELEELQHKVKRGDFKEKE